MSQLPPGTHNEILHLDAYRRHKASDVQSPEPSKKELSGVEAVVAVMDSVVDASYRRLRRVGEALLRVLPPPPSLTAGRLGAGREEDAARDVWKQHKLTRRAVESLEREVHVHPADAPGVATTDRLAERLGAFSLGCSLMGLGCLLCLLGKRQNTR